MDGTGSLRRMEDPAEWLRQCEDLLREETVPEGWVPSSQFICVRVSDDRIVGMIQIRHHLNDHLRQFGGHIGYSVHPAERRKGYARWMLENALPHCRELGAQAGSGDLQCRKRGQPASHPRQRRRI